MHIFYMGGRTRKGVRGIRCNRNHRCTPLAIMMCDASSVTERYNAHLFIAAVERLEVLYG